ncbi:MAG TPA: hypothetical protein VK645_08545 [Chitinophagaceae bacterium]|jgi:hypothetical protein|nr:hypothetical protein [Chitinophagaceae bacterium]
MKNVMKNYKTLAIALFAALSVASTSNVMANEGVKPKSNIDLKFIGNIENQPVFQLNVNNTEDDEYIVTFRDEQNNVLYSGKLKGINITKNFQLSTEDDVNNTMSVEVRSRKSNKSEVYKINRTRSFTDEIVVNKI